MNLPANMPAPGLDGTYRDSCAVCMRGTDTGLAFTGEAEWVAAALSTLGLSPELAAEMVTQATGCEVALFGPGCEVPNYRQPAEGGGA